MHLVEQKPADAAAGEPITDFAERSLRAFGDLTREQVVRLLPYWRDFERPTPAQVAEVLRRFAPQPTQPLPANVDGYGVGGRS